MEAYPQCTRLRRTRSDLSNVDRVQSLLKKKRATAEERKKDDAISEE